MGKGRDKRKRRERKAAKRGSHKRMAEPPFNDSFNDPDAPVYALVKPKPSLRSGAIALPEPDDMDDASQG
jgi:hypothetical protein